MNTLNRGFNLNTTVKLLYLLLKTEEKKYF